MGKRKTDDLTLLKRSLVIGASFNTFFLAFEIAGAVIYRSAWFMALSLYYTVLIALKFYIAFSLDRKGKDALKVFRNVGLVMVIMNLALITLISLMIAYPDFAMHRYSTFISIMIAIWTLVMFAISVAGLALQWGKRNSVAFAGKMIQLIGTTVSLLMLQTSVIASFGASQIEMAHEALSKFTTTLRLPSSFEQAAIDVFDKLALSNSITGVAVGVLVIIATVYMIVKGTEMGKRLIQVKDSIKEKGIKVSSR